MPNIKFPKYKEGSYFDVRRSFSEVNKCPKQFRNPDRLYAPEHIAAKSNYEIGPRARDGAIFGVDYDPMKHKNINEYICDVDAERGRVCDIINAIQSGRIK